MLMTDCIIYVIFIWVTFTLCVYEKLLYPPIKENIKAFGLISQGMKQWKEKKKKWIIKSYSVVLFSPWMTRMFFWNSLLSLLYANPWEANVTA